jgi:hypothetical protein
VFGWGGAKRGSKPRAGPLLEFLLLSIQALVESALGKPLTEASFALAFPAPAYADRCG